MGQSSDRARPAPTTSTVRLSGAVGSGSTAKGLRGPRACGFEPLRATAARRPLEGGAISLFIRTIFLSLFTTPRQVIGYPRAARRPFPPLSGPAGSGPPAPPARGG